jgi:hypothetical protein
MRGLGALAVSQGKGKGAEKSCVSQERGVGCGHGVIVRVEWETEENW